MLCRITITLCLLGLFITKPICGFAHEEKAQEISVKAIKLAVHAGRKTIKAEDIKLAVKE
ncbi:MAG: histone-like protein [Planctomycetota bacterium]